MVDEDDAPHARRREAEQLGARLQHDLDQVTDSVTVALSVGIEQLRGDSELVELMRASVEANIELLIHAVRYGFAVGGMHTPPAAVEYARRVAQRGIEVTALVRAYRLGQSTFLDECFDRIKSRRLPDGEALDLAHHVIGVVSAYIDMVSERVVSEYGSERDRWAGHQGSIRSLRIADILAGGDAHGAETELRYSLHQSHLAVILWIPSESAAVDALTALTQLGRAADTLARAAGAAGGHLLVPVDGATAWLWLPLVPGHAAVDTVGIAHTAGLAHPALAFAIGRPGSGVAGFRRSHIEARLARELGSAHRPAPRRSVAYAEQGLATAALLRNNLDETREWVAGQLGELARSGPAAESLRRTLAVYLSTGYSPKESATRLNLHFNSVKYRVQKATEALGHPVTDDPVGLGVALLAAEWFGDTVLRGADLDSAPAAQPRT